MRINKLFSNYGICSRKDTNRLIEENRIKVNGGICALGQWVEENDEILLDDKPIIKKEKVYIAFNKPTGITCTAENKVKDNIIDFMRYPEYIFPVGRLDKDSQGLIIMTNDGELANEILEADNMHEKEYIVELDKAFDDVFIKKMSEGVEILAEKSTGIMRVSDTLGVTKNVICEQDIKSIEDLDVVVLKKLKKDNKNIKIKTRPCKVSKINENTFKIILTQGINRQIRKMSKVLGYNVISLNRIRIMNINIQDIEIGKWRYLKEDEVMKIRKEINFI